MAPPIFSTATGAAGSRARRRREKAPGSWYVRSTERRKASRSTGAARLINKRSLTGVSVAQPDRYQIDLARWEQYRNTNPRYGALERNYEALGERAHAEAFACARDTVLATFTPALAQRYVDERRHTALPVPASRRTKKMCQRPSCGWRAKLTPYGVARTRSPLVLAEESVDRNSSPE